MYHSNKETRVALSLSDCQKVGHCPSRFPKTGYCFRLVTCDVLMSDVTKVSRTPGDYKQYRSDTAVPLTQRLPGPSYKRAPKGRLREASWLRRVASHLTCSSLRSICFLTSAPIIQLETKSS